MNEVKKNNLLKSYVLKVKLFGLGLNMSLVISLSQSCSVHFDSSSPFSNVFELTDYKIVVVK